MNLRDETKSWTYSNILEKKDTIVNPEDDALNKVKQLEQRIAQQRKKDTKQAARQG